MRRILGFLTLASVTYGIKRMLGLARSRRRHAEQREAVNTWEGEGGAVPIAPNRTAQQTEPGAERSAR